MPHDKKTRFWIYPLPIVSVSDKILSLYLQYKITLPENQPIEQKIRWKWTQPQVNPPQTFEPRPKKSNFPMNLNLGDVFSNYKP
jgi:hypothetical protein